MKKARDSVRITDAKKIQTAVESFYQDISIYPVAGKFIVQAGLDVQDYAPGLIRDARHASASCNGTGGTTICGYTYAVGQVNVANDQFEIGVAFENPGTREQEALGDTGNDQNRLEIVSGNTNNTLDTSKDSGNFGALQTVASTATGIVFSGSVVHLR
jgi:hypothetical protein